MMIVEIGLLFGPPCICL